MDVVQFYGGVGCGAILWRDGCGAILWRDGCGAILGRDELYLPSKYLCRGLGKSLASIDESSELCIYLNSLHSYF